MATDYQSPTSGSAPTDRASESAPPVSIYFEDSIIQHLFSDLLHLQGVRAQVIPSTNQLPAGSRVITEPKLFDRLSAQQRTCALVVANSEGSRPTDAVLTLERPLTERKIERALDAFLKLAR